MIGHHGRHWWMHKLTEFNAKHINPIFTRDSWRLPDQEIIDIYHRYALLRNFHNFMTQLYDVTMTSSSQFRAQVLFLLLE